MWLKNKNVNDETIKLLEYNVGEQLHDLRLGKARIKPTAVCVPSTKEDIQQMRHIIPQEGKYKHDRIPSFPQNLE